MFAIINTQCISITHTINSYNFNLIQKGLTIQHITEFFNYKLNFVSNSHEIFTKTIKISKLDNICNAINITFFDNKSYTHEKTAPDDLSIPMMLFYVLLIELCTWSMQYTNIMDLYPTYDSGVAPFQITPLNLEKTPLDTNIVLDKDLPFEAPIILTIPESDELIPIAATYSLVPDVKNSIISPGVEGTALFHSSQIFHMHLDIVGYVKNTMDQYEVINSYETVSLIRKLVHEHCQTNPYIQNLTVKDLQNTNHVMNLIVREMLVNSIFVSDEEAFLLKEISKALIIESLCLIQHRSTDYFYNDPEGCNATTQMIISRFL